MRPETPLRRLVGLLGRRVGESHPCSTTPELDFRVWVQPDAAPRGSQDLSWEVFESLSTPLAEIVGNRAAAREIAFSCVRLGRVLDGAWRKPSAAIAKALDLPLERVAASLASLRQDLASAVEHAAAVVAHFKGTEAARWGVRGRRVAAEGDHGSRESSGPAGGARARLEDGSRPRGDSSSSRFIDILSSC